MLSSRAILFLGALSFVLLTGLAALSLHLATAATPAPAAAPAAPAPDYLDLAADPDTYPVPEAFERFLEAVQRQYPVPESATIDARLAPTALYLAVRLNAFGDTLDLALTAASQPVAEARADTLRAFLDDAGLDPALLRIDAGVGPADLVRRPTPTRSAFPL